MGNTINPYPTITDIDPVEQSPPSMKGWYLNNTVRDVPQEALAWLTGAGWKVDDTYPETETVPGATEEDDPTEEATGNTLYALSRVTVQNWTVLRDLLTSFTNAYNEGRYANDQRYDDILTSWCNVLAKFQDQVGDFDDATRATDGYITLMVSGIDSLTSDYTSYSADIEGYDTVDRTNALANLKTQWLAQVAETDAAIETTEAAYDLSTIIAACESAIDDFDAAVAAFNATYATLPATLTSDFAAHAVTARALLTDLGTTELARINELFDNQLASRKQALLDRGFYSATLITSIDSRVERERSQAIGELNDRLMREKLANEHTLYGEQYQSRLGGLDASLKAMDAQLKLVQATLNQKQWSVEIRHKTLGIVTELKNQLLGSRERYYQLLLKDIDWKSSRRAELYQGLMEVRLKQFELRHRTCGRDMELMRYYLDERNKLVVSLFQFMEDRTDSYPDMGTFAQLTAAMGEAGATTWQPQ